MRQYLNQKKIGGRSSTMRYTRLSFRYKFAKKLKHRIKTGIQGDLMFRTNLLMRPSCEVVCLLYFIKEQSYKSTTFLFMFFFLSFFIYIIYTQVFNSIDYYASFKFIFCSRVLPFLEIQEFCDKSENSRPFHQKHLRS